MVGAQHLLLLIEDDASLRRYLRATLASFGYLVEEAATGAQGLDLAASLDPDLVLLDLGLPDMDGLDLARGLRSWSRIPIIVLSARRKEEDMVRALDAGADDYLTKPFGTGELLARIRVALRRAEDLATSTPGGPVTIGHLMVDLPRREVRVAGAEVHLSPNEFILLTTLLKHAGKVLTHRQLTLMLPGSSYSAQPNGLLRVHMANLRKKLEPDPARPRLLMTEPGVGYRLKAEP